MRISERTAVTVTSFAGMVKVVSAADALAKSTPSLLVHCTNALPSEGSFAVIVTAEPTSAGEFVVLPSTTVMV